ncbi:conserved hypothetical protein [Luteimonas sp. 9C]|uniref:DUF3253 domain-containing protein n=1 Tax=Luteimonas sp. 9C TaxID=2653148 RepID=UPI0012F3E1AB|nr:DUF3253 domain-containing protein [Luteimonas sp. 9C]VXB13594.1 conserved hypothetical protein [Luteimonas sp. 9C]
MALPADDRIAADILALLRVRAPDASICPSEVARRLYDEASWRTAMPDVRRVACALAAARRIRITQADVVLDPDTPIAGAIRLRRGPVWDEDAARD